MAEANHRVIETNGISMHIAEQGEGPLVVLCHGFPEWWYSWRHQLPALAEAGYHAVAPDKRGYGQTDRPEPIEAYSMFQLTRRHRRPVRALGEEHGGDRRARLGRAGGLASALLRPDRFRAVALLSVPYSRRAWKASGPPRR